MAKKISRPANDQRSGEAQQILHKFGGTTPAVI
jgi:hypothetical protein